MASYPKTLTKMISRSQKYKLTVYLAASFISFISFDKLKASNDYLIDHRFSTNTWHSPLGLPGDWHKPMVSDRGALLYDFGPGPYAKPKTVIEFGVSGESLENRQQIISDVRKPIYTTHLSNSHSNVVITTLAIPPLNTSASQSNYGKYERLDGISGALGWAHPSCQSSPEFNSVAWGINRPLRYRLKVQPGAFKRIVLGFCESYKPRLGERLALMQVEGATDQLVDLALTAPINTPQVFIFEAKDTNNDGWLDISVKAPVGSDPNTTLAMIAMYSNAKVNPKIDRNELILGSRASRDLAELRISCGAEMLMQAARTDAIQASFSPSVSPALNIKTGRQLEINPSGVLSFNDHPFITCSPKAESISHDDTGWHIRWALGTKLVTVYVLSGNTTQNDAKEALSYDFQEAKSLVSKRWNKTEVPFGHFHVGDPEIQNIAENSLRTYYQAHEIINGQGQFNSSFTLYRGLWTSDAMYLIEVAAMLGDFSKAKQTLDTIFSFQDKDGLIDELPPLVIYRSTPEAIWCLTRYARLSGDWNFLKKHWPAVMKGIQALRTKRISTLNQPTALNSGLLPAGFNDGGIPETAAEYSSIYWTITGLNAAAQAAHKIGYLSDASAIEQLSDSFISSFTLAANRDFRKDSFGNQYLPVRVGMKGNDPYPQVAQWAVLENHLFGYGLPLNGSLLDGTLAMLKSAEKEGIPAGTGWMPEGVWAGYAGLYGHLPLLRGDYTHAARILYAFANHSSPTGNWVEEQSLITDAPKTSGDEPHCWAAALFVRLTISMLACEYKDTVHLLLSTPDTWLKPNMVNRIDSLNTAGGLISLNLKVSSDGRTVSLNVHAPAQGNTILHLSSMKASGFHLNNYSDKETELVLKAGGTTSYTFSR